MPRGGRRPGAGRKPKHPKRAKAPAPPRPAIDWGAVREAASFGSPEETIIRGLDIPESALLNQAELARFRREIAIGHAKYELELRRAIRSRGQKSGRWAGSVNALALQARNILDWDKQIPAQETEPDLGTARQRLRDLFALLAKSRSETEGRPVTVLELLHREAEIRPEGGEADA